MLGGYGMTHSHAAVQNTRSAVSAALQIPQHFVFYCRRFQRTDQGNQFDKTAIFVDFEQLLACLLKQTFHHTTEIFCTVKGVSF